MDEKTNKRLGKLLFNLAKGNKSALTEIYSIMGKILYAIGNLFFYNEDDIKDSIQTFLLTIYESAKKFKRNKNAYAWIVSSYCNLCKNQLKKRNIEKKHIYEYLENLKLNKQSPDQFLEKYLFVNEIMDILDENERLLVFYHIHCQYSINEISKMLTIPKSTIQYKLDKIKQKIKNSELFSYETAL